MAKIDTIFFDVDGTLVDARRDIAGAMNRVLARYSRPGKSVELITSYVGTGVKDLIQKSMETDDQSLVDKATALYEEEYLKHPADYAVLYPGVTETLEALKNERKYILTNRYAHLAEALLEKIGILKYFLHVFGGDDEDCIKPSACVLENISKKLHVDKKRALIVGDMAVDVMTGKNSCIRSCWVTYGLGRKEDVLPLKPDYVVDDIRELTRIVGHT